MHKITLLKIITLIGFLSFFSCNKESFTETTVKQDHSKNAAAIHAHLTKLGCPADKIEDYGDFFLADGDIAIPKNMNLRKFPTSSHQAQEEQAYSTLPNSLIVGGLRQRDIKLLLSSEMSAYVGEVGAAAQKWNIAADNNISFRRVTANGDVLINWGDFPGNAPIQFAQIPTQGEPGRTITLNRRIFPRLPSAQRIAVLTHALGHIIGFVHTDWRAEGGAGKDIPAVWSSDPSSVMNSAVHKGTRFVANPSIYDYAALKMLYPLKPLYLTLTLLNRTTVSAKWVGPIHPFQKYQLWYRITQNGHFTQLVIDVNLTDRQCEAVVNLPAGGSVKFEAQVRTVYLDNYVSPYSELKSITRGADPL